MCNDVAFCGKVCYNRFMLPEHPAVLLSYVNTKLRDEYASLDALCEDFGVDRGEIEVRLAAYGYCYNEAQNRFIPQE